VLGAFGQADPAADAAGGDSEIHRHRVRVPERLRDIVPGYLERQRSGVRTLLDASEVGDYQTAATFGHRMKGSGSGYGLDRITEIGAAIEQAARQRDAGKLRELAQELEDFLRRVAVEYE
jgi:HPt (histidine-containing phosphotransfer) domain-containing protein